MNDIVDRAITQVGASLLDKKRNKEFLVLYRGKAVEDVDWVELCDDIKTYNSYKIGFHIILEMLRNNLYRGAYAEELYENLDIYNALAINRTSTISP